MAYYAMIVVVEADLETEAREVVTDALTTPASLQAGLGPVKFVGDPWTVEPIGATISTPVADYRHEFDTANCIDQWHLI